ncbi:MAG: dihydrofolate reductase family protein [Nocardioides sp.]
MRVLTGPDTDDLAVVYAAPSAPWLRLNFVSTVDGAAQGADGKSGGINNAADKVVFDTLRSLADAIVVGAGTARTEGYRPVATPIVVVSGSGQVPPRLRGGEPGQVLLVTHAASPGLDEARDVLGVDQVLVLGASEVDLGSLVPALVARGFDDLLCEGGPRLARDLVGAGAVDELCVTTVPHLIAGEQVRLLTGGQVEVPLRLASLLEEDGTVLARWFVERAK